ncbi:hypothetical protein E2C01_034990 [Portunus trituberculatus]|uniref:Uncharacterized protein n=1 Tax=Portunus trituberculatus TaxID=210409 RepID=A0A5B7F200_PORTR|nr:hypothetical protein [Portunus trituberculatus]
MKDETECPAQHLNVPSLPVTLQDEVAHKVLIVVLHVVTSAVDELAVVGLLGNGAGCRDPQHGAGTVHVVPVNVPLVADQPTNDISVHLFQPPPPLGPTSLSGLLHRHPSGGNPVSSLLNSITNHYTVSCYTTHKPTTIHTTASTQAQLIHQDYPSLIHLITARLEVWGGWSPSPCTRELRYMSSGCQSSPRELGIPAAMRRSRYARLRERGKEELVKRIPILFLFSPLSPLNNLHNSLVLFKQFVGEFRQYLQEGQVGWWLSGISLVLRRVHSKEDALPVQSSDGLPVLDSIQAKGQSKPLC